MCGEREGHERRPVWSLNDEKTSHACGRATSANGRRNRLILKKKKKLPKQYFIRGVTNMRRYPGRSATIGACLIEHFAKTRAQLPVSHETNRHVARLKMRTHPRERTTSERKRPISAAAALHAMSAKISQTMR